MQTFTRFALVASALAATASAGSVHAHHAHYHKKPSAASYGTAVASANSTSTACGCTTYTTTWYGEGGLVQDTPTYAPNSTVVAPVTTSSTTTSTLTSSIWVTPSAETPSSTYVAPTSTYVAPPPSSTVEAVPSTSEAPTSTYEAPVTTSKAPAPVWSAPPQPSSGGDHHDHGNNHGGDNNHGSSSPITNNGDKWAMTYTPYDHSGNCKSADAVASDIASMKAKGFSTVRIYATDCSGPQNVGNACKANGMKMIVGIYIDNAGIGSKTDEQIDTLCAWGKGQWDMVEMVVAGNEAIFNNYCSAGQMADFISHVKGKFQAAGYNGPVTTTEPLGTIQENKGTLCPAVDVIAANIHPFFNNAVTAKDAGDFVARSMSDLSDCCGGSKEAYNLETGWPSQGSANGLALPGSNDQKTAVMGIMAAAGGKSAIFSFENDGWKAPGALGVEQFWGCSNLFG